MDISAISAAVSSLKTAKDIAQGLLALKSLSEVQGKVIDLQSAILDAQGKALDAQAGLVELQDELKTANQRIAELTDHHAFVSALNRSNGMSHPETQIRIARGALKSVSLPYIWWIPAKSKCAADSGPAPNAKCKCRGTKGEP